MTSDADIRVIVQSDPTATPTQRLIVELLLDLRARTIPVAERNQKPALCQKCQLAPATQRMIYRPGIRAPPGAAEQHPHVKYFCEACAIAMRGTAEP